MACISNVVYVGPWGGAGGQPWSFRTNGGKINEIIITTNGSTINSLEFGYTDKDGKCHPAGPFGTPLTNAQVFHFAEDEDFIAVSGTFGMWSGLRVITSLAFQTNKRVCGPVGNEFGTNFSLPVRGVFEGFFGNSGAVIDGFGAVLCL